MKIQRVFCPVDFSQTSRKALRYAGAIASWCDAVLDVMHVLPDPAASREALASAVPADIATKLRAAADASLRRFVDEAAVSVRVAGLSVHSGYAAAEIVDHARSTKPDLLVMGTHGQSGLRHFLMGSNAERVIAHAICPVLTVPRNAGEVGMSPLVQFKRLLVACDFSDASSQALEYGLSLARDYDGTITLLHVIETLREEDVLYAADQRTIDYIQQRKKQAVEALHRLADRGMRSAAMTCERVELGRPAPTILRVASEIHADLIVMGTHGRGSLGAALFGSATRAVLRGATCPVLTARAPVTIGD